MGHGSLTFDNTNTRLLCNNSSAPSEGLAGLYYLTLSLNSDQELQETFYERAYHTSAKGAIDSGCVHHCNVPQAEIAPMPAGRRLR